MRAKALLLMLFAAAAVEAQAPPSFREGVLAFEKKEWAAAEKAMRAAVAGNPNESAGTVSIAGSWYETYVPHYFLARALAKQGKCAEALREFEESERQGVTPTIPDFARHLTTRGGCKPQAEKPKPQREAGTFEVPFGEGPNTTTTPVTKPKPQTPPTPKPEVVKPITPQPQPQSQPQAQRDDAAEQANRETRKRLADAINAYLRGQYEETIRLTTVQFNDRIAMAEAALFRAAARDALYRIGGATNEALRREVELDLRAYRELHPNGQPDPRIFPPRFIAMAARP